MGEMKAPRGEKTALVERAIAQRTEEFGISDIQNACPCVGVDLIRQVLKRFKESSEVICLGRGHSAKWRKTGK
jgi:hypothetical protein